jgi:hypothetical protein
MKISRQLFQCMDISQKDWGPARCDRWDHVRAAPETSCHVHVEIFYPK